MKCPKCQRPIEDTGDGPYVCCAGAALRWHCTACDKHSQGFAFPYGRCPACGGRLELVDAAPSSRSADEAQALAAVRMAFEVELGGRAFYQRAAADSRELELRTLFGRLAVMEGQHMEALASRYHLERPDPAPDFRVEVAAIFAEVEHRPQDPVNLFRIAIGLEQRAARLFGEHAAKAPEGSAEQRLFRELAAEEHEHADLLRGELARWLAGRPGLLGSNPSGGAAGPAVAAAGVAPALLNAAAALLQGHDPQRLALQQIDGQQLSYGELRDRVARCAAVWRARGIGPGHRVAIKLGDGIDWVTAFLGSIWCGAVAVGINPRAPASDWQYILDEAGFSAVLAESADDTPPAWRARVLPLAAWRAELLISLPLAAQPMDEDAPALWVHSSGTSGKPKAVVHAQRCVRHIEQVSRDGLGLVAGDRLFASSRLFFSYPQTNGLFAGLKLGATILLDPQWPNAASVAASVAALRPTVLFSVPSLYRNLLHEGFAPGIAQAGVRLCVAAGEALPASLRDDWQRQTGLTIINGYGASETLVLVMLDRGDGRDFQASPGVDIRPVGAATSGAPTRLLIRAPTLALGYLDRPQAQAEAFRGEAFCPADLWVNSDAGGWRFAGREDSLVKIHGRWVNLVALEEQLSLQAPGIAEAVAVCVPDADGVDAVALFFVASDRAAVEAALRTAAGTLPPHQRPRWLHAVDQLPRTATGKLLRRKLQELHRELN